MGVLLSLACLFHSLWKGHITIPGDYQGTSYTFRECPSKVVGERTPHILEDQFASVLNSLKSSACAFHILQRTTIILSGKFRLTIRTIEAITKGLSSKEDVFSLHGQIIWSMYHVLGVAVDAWHACLFYIDQAPKL